jgi:hypothetical protein
VGPFTDYNPVEPKTRKKSSRVLRIPGLMWVNSIA